MFNDRTILPVIIVAIKIKDHSIGILYMSMRSIFIPTKTKTTARPKLKSQNRCTTPANAK